MPQVALTPLQKAVRLGIRLMLPVFTLAGFGGMASMFLIGLSDQKSLQVAWSPDRHYRATLVEQSSGSGCQERPAHFVLIERSWFGIKTGATSTVCLPGSPAAVRLQWRGSEELVIACPHGEFNGGVDEGQWGQLRLRYDLEGN